jgi:hypothetical protein
MSALGVGNASYSASCAGDHARLSNIVFLASRSGIMFDFAPQCLLLSCSLPLDPGPCSINTAVSSTIVLCRLSITIVRLNLDASPYVPYE